MSETQDYNRHFGRVEEDEEDVPKQEDRDFDESTSVEALRARIEEIQDNVSPDTLQSLQEALNTAEIWQGRSVLGRDWQEIINNLGKQVVSNLEVNKFSVAEENLAGIHDDIRNLERESIS